MNFIKMKNHPLVRVFAVIVLSFFVVGILYLPAQAYENVDMDQVLGITDDESISEPLMEIIRVTTHIVQCDISSEEKAEVLAEILGYDCEEIYALVLLFEELDNFIPFLGIITNVLWWLVYICESYVF